jgi:GH15 family glucan-1,4-alpha-glucosidase
MASRIEDYALIGDVALMGRVGDACKLLERPLTIRNDVGLLAEEYDPIHDRLLGNFLQAFSHVGLINTAGNLASHGGAAEHCRQSS